MLKEKEITMNDLNDMLESVNFKQAIIRHETEEIRLFLYGIAIVHLIMLVAISLLTAVTL